MMFLLLLHWNGIHENYNFPPPHTHTVLWEIQLNLNLSILCTCHILHYDHTFRLKHITFPLPFFIVSYSLSKLWSTQFWVDILVLKFVIISIYFEDFTFLTTFICMCIDSSCWHRIWIFPSLFHPQIQI